MADIKFNYADDETEEKKPSFVEKLRGAGRTAGKYAKRGYETAKKVGGHIQRGARALDEGSVKVARGITKTATAFKKFAKPRYEALSQSNIVNPFDIGGFGDMSDLTTPNIGSMRHGRSKRGSDQGGLFTLNSFGQISMQPTVSRRSVRHRRIKHRSTRHRRRK